MPKTKKSEKFPLQPLLDAAERHGWSSEPDHEVGDLQDLLFDCWKVMSLKQKKKVYEGAESMLEMWGVDLED